jgi:hypothetical protein
VLASHARSGGRRHQAKEPIIPLLSGAHADHFLTDLDRPVFARSVTLSSAPSSSSFGDHFIAFLTISRTCDYPLGQRRLASSSFHDE